MIFALVHWRLDFSKSVICHMIICEFMLYCPCFHVNRNIIIIFIIVSMLVCGFASFPSTHYWGTIFSYERIPNSSSFKVRNNGIFISEKTIISNDLDSTKFAFLYVNMWLLLLRYGSADFPRINHHSVPGSLSQLPYIMTRRHFSNTTSISSTGSDTFTPATAADASVNTDDYVGRCIPMRLYEMLRVISAYVISPVR